MSASLLHRRLTSFVTWIRPDPDRVDDARSQRDEVRDRIRGQAEADGLVVRSTPNSGSFAKATGLRRHMLGGAEHEGQDIDCSFVVSPKNEGGDVLTDLLSLFDGYAKQSYPSTPRERKKSCVRLSFVASKLEFDLVPLLAVEGRDDEQMLLRAGGERRRTSIQKHVEFIQGRTKRSKETRGPVAFNDTVRLAKWWREYQVTRSNFIDEAPTFLIDLLCAKAFDETSVKATYSDTLLTWFDKIHSYANSRAVVSFQDYAPPRPEAIDAKWKVIDPVNGENNAVPKAWGGIQIDELRDWARLGRDRLQQAIAFDMRGRDSDALALMGEVFGPTFKNHSEA